MFSVTSIQLPLAGWTPTGENADAWSNSAGDTLSIHYFPMPPDLAVPLCEMVAVEEAYRRLLGKRGAVVEMALDSIQGCDALCAIFKLRQQPSDVEYMATLMIPFRDHNFMVKVTCHEAGPADFRESEVAKRLGFSVSQLRGRGCALDSVTRNESDDKEWDALFPGHPLSRARTHLQDILMRAELPPDVRQLAPFAGACRSRSSE